MFFHSLLRGVKSGSVQISEMKVMDEFGGMPKLCG